jgi:hypothetical protein
LTTNLPSIAKQLRVLQAPIDPVHWGENWSWFADALGTNDLSEIVARYWTGDFAYMTTMRTVKDVFDPNASRPYVALLGNPKPQDAIDWLQRMCQEYDDLGMRLVSKPVSPGVFEFSMGAKLVARLAPGQGFLAVAGGDEASRLLLRDVLETRGQAKPPAILAKRLGPEKSKRPRCLTFVTHVVNQLDFQLQISRAAGQPDDPRLVEYLEGISEAVKGDLGFGAGYATVTPDGILIRSSY